MENGKFNWWLDLRHGGMIISTAVLKEVFPEGYIEPSRYLYQNLRDNYLKFETWWNNPLRSSTQLAPLNNWIDTIFEKFLKLNSNQWRKGNEITPALSVTTLLGEKIKPNRLFYRTASDEKASIALFIDANPRLGLGKSKKGYARMLEYLRGQKIKLGIYTNGMQIRLCYAGLDHDSWAEWDTSNWFYEGEFLPQLYGFYSILGGHGLNPRGDFSFPLLDAIESSRTRQGELSSILGEQVRQSIEILLNEFGRTSKKYPELAGKLNLNPDGTSITSEAALSAIYQASVRLVMRLVVIFFAEARDLLPKSNELYHSHYGIEGLFEQLRRAKVNESAEFLENVSSGWLRLSGLFSIIYSGSPHPDLQIPAYGGQLFEPGNIKSSNPVKRALALFEDRTFELNNASVLKILEKLKYGKVKIKQGRSSSYVKGPVDFRELRTEFIGMIYEGILDYELKSAGEPTVLLNAGLQPILQLSVLEGLSDKQLKDLFEKLKQKDDSGGDESEEDAAGEMEAEDTVASEEDEEAEPAEEPENAQIPAEDETARRALMWAIRAVETQGMVKKPGRKEDEYLYQIKLKEKAHSLIKEVYDTGDYYITRWGGTRKGTGTFYTRPQLAIPTVRRTLEPLCYTKDTDIIYEIKEEFIPEGVNEPTEKYSSERIIPRLPEEILSVKVCDPACGSGSFLVASVNYLTNALYDSLIYHADLLDTESARRKTLPLGIIGESAADENILPCMPDEDDFEARVKANLKRYIVENCIYGVDLNPTAVELARLSLWIETMDKNLPFEFLDHKIKTGNSLVGAWLDTFQEYPLAAWMREGGDKTHSTGINYTKEAWTKAIKNKFNDTVKKEMAEVIQLRSSQLNLGFMGSLEDPVEGHRHIAEKYNELHRPDLSVFSLERKSKLFEELLNSEIYKNVKSQMDLWCSIWFWPGDKLDLCPSPGTFYNPGKDSVAVSAMLSHKHNFFHWEIEFPDVFNPGREGFDAVVGNPPWEISKPNSKEFFSNVDPIYRTYGKQEALSHQKRIFTSNASIEHEWLNYNAYLKGMSNYVKNAAFASGDPVESEDYKISIGKGKLNDNYHTIWREIRKKHKCFSDKLHPFRHQGSADLNTYKMFLEHSYRILKDKGRLGMIVPSGIYSDKGTQGLRDLFINKSSWEWLYSFENKLGIFDIHRSFKFNPIIIQKGNETKKIKSSFMQHAITNWEEENNIVKYDKEQLERFSPYNSAFLEVKTKLDINIIEKIFNNSVLWSNNDCSGWNMKFTTEYHMTNDSHFFNKKESLENKGFTPDKYGRWINNKGKLAYPLYEGRMIDQFDFSAKGWISGTGRSAIWEDLGYDQKDIKPNYLMFWEDIDKSETDISGYKLPTMNITSSTNKRTLITGFIKNFPCNHSINPIRIKGLNENLIFLAFANSFIMDYVLRQKLIGLNLSYFILDELPIIPLEKITFKKEIVLLSSKLALNHKMWCPEWLKLKENNQNLIRFGIKRLQAFTFFERLRIRCMLDAIITEQFGLNYDEFSYILRNDPTDPKGFWRIDKDKPVQLRQTTLTLLAFKRLKEVGLEEFIKEDWQFPEEIQAQLGPRFLDWQLKETPEESWAECEYHAKQILGEEEFRKFMEDSNSEYPSDIKKDNYVVKEKSNDEFTLF